MTPKLAWLTDPTVFRVNRLDAHSDHITYASEAEMQTGTTSLRQCLDGLWKFRWSENPASRPENFWEPGFDDTGFASIRVPGHMETQGYGQIQYINKLYPWDGHAALRPPEIDWDHTCVGSYVTVFDLAPGLVGRKIAISFQGVENAMYLWLNGHFIGYSEDSFTPSDFDLTPYIQSTGNRLCVEVYQHSSASWLEDQDFFRFSGIFRSVYLYAREDGCIEDLWLKTNLAPDNRTGSLQVRLKLQGTAPSVRLTLSHPRDGILFDGPLLLTEKGGYHYSQKLVFPHVRLWDHETPELYRAVLTTGSGVIPYDVGFRRMERRGSVLYLNGKRLTLNGVNRHEWNPNTGRCITLSDMTDAIKVFRENNINAVRTCHYPNRSEWYTLCDQNGIYMMDETNLETHGSWQKDGIGVDARWNIPGSLPQWHDCVLDRANSMFQRDKNHVSILFWSCGNESYGGSNLVDMADFFRAQDPSRVVHYEGIFWCREFQAASDVESRMYADPVQIRIYLENDPRKPFLNCEYMHNMGNSLGGMEHYIRLGADFDSYHGGFIWDYMDQALWQTTPWGERVLGYGGDFGERQTDYAFSGNGIVAADGTPKPCMQEVRYWYLPPKERAQWDAENRQSEALAEPLPGRKNNGRLVFTDGDGAYGIRGNGFEILFSKLQGGPVSLLAQGRQWLWRAPKLAFWRAPTENDLGCRFPQKSGVWNGVDLWQDCTGYRVVENTEDAFAIRYSYGSSILEALDATITYRITGAGLLHVQTHYTGIPGAPELPVFGIRFETPRPVEKTRWLGLSGETYPDRYKGGKFGIHQESPHIPNYLVPQECGGHTRTHWAAFQMEGSTLTVEKDTSPFHFSAIPYTPAELQQARHVYELPRPSRTVITLASRMRGVGGIDSWGSDVEPGCRISGEEDQEMRVVFHL